jgi:hypothetical protein
MISVKLSQIIDVDLSASEAKDITIKYICTNFDWKSSYYIRKDEKDNEDYIFYKEVIYSSHSFEIEHQLRKATDRDKIVYQFLQEILNT